MKKYYLICFLIFILGQSYVQAQVPVPQPNVNSKEETTTQIGKPPEQYENSTQMMRNRAPTSIGNNNSSIPGATIVPNVVAPPPCAEGFYRCSNPNFGNCCPNDPCYYAQGITFDIITSSPILTSRPTSLSIQRKGGSCGCYFEWVIGSNGTGIGTTYSDNETITHTFTAPVPTKISVYAFDGTSNAYGCASGQKHIWVYPQDPCTHFTAQVDKTCVDIDETFTISASGLNAGILTIKEGEDTILEQEIIADGGQISLPQSHTTNGTYTYILKDSKGCQKSMQVDVFPSTTDMDFKQVTDEHGSIQLTLDHIPEDVDVSITFAGKSNNLVPAFSKVAIPHKPGFYALVLSNARGGATYNFIATQSECGELKRGAISLSNACDFVLSGNGDCLPFGYNYYTDIVASMSANYPGYQTLSIRKINGLGAYSKSTNSNQTYGYGNNSKDLHLYASGSTGHGTYRISARHQMPNCYQEKQLDIQVTPPIRSEHFKPRIYVENGQKYIFIENIYNTTYIEWDHPMELVSTGTHWWGNGVYTWQRFKYPSVEEETDYIVTGKQGICNLASHTIRIYPLIKGGITYLKSRSGSTMNPFMMKALLPSMAFEWLKKWKNANKNQPIDQITDLRNELKNPFRQPFFLEPFSPPQDCRVSDPIPVCYEEILELDVCEGDEGSRYQWFMGNKPLEEENGATLSFTASDLNIIPGKVYYFSRQVTAPDGGVAKSEELPIVFGSPSINVNPDDVSINLKVTENISHKVEADIIEVPQNTELKLTVISDSTQTLPDGTQYWWYQKDSKNGNLINPDNGIRGSTLIIKDNEITFVDNANNIYTYVLIMVVPIWDKNGASCLLVEKEVKLKPIECPVFKQLESDTTKACPNEPFDLEATFDGLPLDDLKVSRYTWTRNGQTQILGDSKKYQDSTDSSATYYCTAIFANGCPSLVQKFRVNIQKSSPKATVNTPICVGFKKGLTIHKDDIGLKDFDGEIRWQKLENNVPVEDTTGHKFVLENIKQDLKYRITTELNGCKTETDFDIKIFPTEPDLILGATEMCDDPNKLIAPPDIEGTIYTIEGSIETSIEPNSSPSQGPGDTFIRGRLPENTPIRVGGRDAILLSHNNPQPGRPTHLRFMVRGANANLVHVGHIPLTYQLINSDGNPTGYVKTYRFLAKSETLTKEKVVYSNLDFPYPHEIRYEWFQDEDKIGTNASYTIPGDIAKGNYIYTRKIYRVGCTSAGIFTDDFEVTVEKPEIPDAGVSEINDSDNKIIEYVPHKGSARFWVDTDKEVEWSNPDYKTDKEFIQENIQEDLEYTVQVTDEAFSCPSTPVSVSVIVCPNQGGVGTDTTICEGKAVTLDIEEVPLYPSFDSKLKYKWYIKKEGDPDFNFGNIELNTKKLALSTAHQLPVGTYTISRLIYRKDTTKCSVESEQFTLTITGNGTPTPKPTAKTAPANQADKPKRIPKHGTDYYLSESGLNVHFEAGLPDDFPEDNIKWYTKETWEGWLETKQPNLSLLASVGSGNNLNQKIDKNTTYYVVAHPSGTSSCDTWTASPITVYLCEQSWYGEPNHTYILPVGEKLPATTDPNQDKNGFLHLLSENYTPAPKSYELYRCVADSCKSTIVREDLDNYFEKFEAGEFSPERLTKINLPEGYYYVKALLDHSDSLFNCSGGFMASHVFEVKRGARSPTTHLDFLCPDANAELLETMNMDMSLNGYVELVPGYAGGGLRLASPESYLAVNSLETLKKGEPFSAELSFRFFPNPKQPSEKILLASPDGFEVLLRPTASGDEYFPVFRMGEGQEITLEDKAIIANHLMNWSHIGVTWSDGKAGLYLQADGKNEKLNGQDMNFPDLPDDPKEKENKLFIGGHPDQTTTGRLMVDEVKIYHQPIDEQLQWEDYLERGNPDPPSEEDCQGTDNSSTPNPGYHLGHALCNTLPTFSIDDPSLQVSLNGKPVSASFSPSFSDKITVKRKERIIVKEMEVGYGPEWQSNSSDSCRISQNVLAATQAGWASFIINTATDFTFGFTVDGQSATYAFVRENEILFIQEETDKIPIGWVGIHEVLKIKRTEEGNIAYYLNPNPSEDNPVTPVYVSKRTHKIGTPTSAQTCISSQEDWYLIQCGDASGFWATGLSFSAPSATRSVETTFPTYHSKDILQVGATTYNPYHVLDKTSSSSFRQGYVASMEQNIWKADATYAYVNEGQTRTFYGDGTANPKLSVDGTMALTWFRWEPQGLLPVYTPKEWLRTEKVTRYNAKGLGTESRDIYGIYGGVLYGYQQRLVIASGVNTRYDELGFEGFENTEYTGNIDIQGHVNVQRQYVLENGYNQNAYAIENLTNLSHELTKAIAPSWFIDSYYVNANTTNHTAFTQHQKLTLPTVEYDETKPQSQLCFDTNLWGAQSNPDPNHVAHIYWEGQLVLTYTGWNPSLSTQGRAKISGEHAHTGKQSLKLGDTPITLTQYRLRPLPNKDYVLSAWVSTGKEHIPSNITISVIFVLPDGKTQHIKLQPKGYLIEGWQRIEGKVKAPSCYTEFKIVIEGANQYIDDVRFFPAKGNMQSFVYDEQNYRLQATLDANNYATFYYYNPEGQLFLTKRETAQGVYTIQETMGHMHGRKQK